MDDPEPLTVVSYAFTNKTCLTGTSKGNIVVWNGQATEKIVSGHIGRVCSMLSRSNVLVTGGEGGLVIIWNNKLEILDKINVHELMESKCIIRAVDLSNSGAYLIGTSNAEIIEITQNGHRVVVNGHSEGELWGLCASPNKEQFITCSGNKFVHLWEPTEMLVKREFSEEAKVCDWALNGEYAVVAFLNGIVRTLNPAEDLMMLSEIQSSFEQGKCISEIKIAPSNQLIAFGCAPNASKIELLKVLPNGNNLQKMKLVDIGMAGSLVHMDWDASSVFLALNSSNYELVYMNTATCSTVKASVCADNNWATWTSVFGFNVKGLALSLVDHVDVNTVCRSQNRRVLAVGDDYGRVKLFKYPYTDVKATYKSYIGHSSRVAKVAFIGDKYLVSIGCTDRTIIVWDFYLDISTEEAAEAQNEKLANYSESEDADPVMIDKTLMLKQDSIAGLVAPSKFIKPPDGQSRAPRVGLRLKHVYGYKGKNCRNNVAYLKNQCIAYNAALLGIVYDIESNTQRFFKWHTSEIIAMTFHPDGVRIATGDRQANPCIHIWDSTTCIQLIQFQGQLEIGIRCLAYSYSGDYLVAIDMSAYHVLAVYDANNAILLATSKTDRAEILSLAFKGENMLVTVGVKHYMFWNISNKCLTSRKGIFGEMNDILGCVAAEKDLLLTGNKLGEVYRWNGINIEATVKIHTNAIDCITIAEQMYA